MIFQQIGTFKSYNFVNVESGYEEIAKDIGDKDLVKDDRKSGLPEEEVTQFCLWLKDCTQPYVSRVTLTKRLKGDTPCVLFGQYSSKMQIMMNMMQQQMDDPK